MAPGEHIYKFLCVKECAQHGKPSQDDALGRFEAGAKPDRCSLDDDILPFGKYHASLLLAYGLTQFHVYVDMQMMDDLDDAFAYIFHLPFLILPSAHAFYHQRVFHLRGAIFPFPT